MNFDYAKKSKQLKPGATKLKLVKKQPSFDKELMIFDAMLVICAILLISIGLGLEWWVK